MIMSFPNESKSNRPMEDQTSRGMFDTLKPTRCMVDLRAMADDKTVLKNPHKGWFWHYIDNGCGAGLYRDRELDEKYTVGFPGLNHLYLRFDWGDVEKEKGVYDFSYIDEVMDKWGKLGFTFSLRVVCFETHPFIPYATPKYVYEEGAHCFRLDNGKIHPDYDDPYFLERLEEFFKVLGAKFNNDDRIELIDVGTYGTWGEGHTVEGDGVIYPIEVIKKHFELHMKYFPDKYVISNDDHIIGRLVHGQEEVDEMLDYCVDRGLGLQDDSICCDGYATDMGYDTMRAAWAFDKTAKNAPSVIEFAHYTYIRPALDCYFRDGFTIIEALKNSHATFAGFHGYPDSWLKNEMYLTEYCANRLGYWFFVPYAIVPDRFSPSAHNTFRVAIENKGWARSYWPYEMRASLRNEKNSYTLKLDADIRHIESGETNEFNLAIDLRDVEPGEYTFSIGLFEKDRPVKLALKEELKTEDGYYKIKKVTVG